MTSITGNVQYTKKPGSTSSGSAPPSPGSISDNDHNKNQEINLTKEQWLAVKQVRNKFATYVSATVKHQEAGGELDINALKNLFNRLSGLQKECIVAPKVNPSHRYHWGTAKQEAVKRGLVNYDELLQRLRDHRKAEEEAKCMADITGNHGPSSSKCNPLEPSSSNQLLASLKQTIPPITEEPMDLIGRTERIPKKNNKRKIADLSLHQSLPKKQRLNSVMYMIVSFYFLLSFYNGSISSFYFYLYLYSFYFYLFQSIGFVKR